jgi:DNA transposition AAA+ family ATPase
MENSLLERKKKLLEEIDSIDKQIDSQERIKGQIKMMKDLDKLQEFTDILNSMFQDSTVEFYSQEASNLLYEAMQILDKIAAGLEGDIEDFEMDILED